MSFSNYTENLLGEAILGLDTWSNVAAEIATTDRYLALLKMPVGQTPMWDPTNQSPEGNDAEAEKLATILSPSLEIDDPSYERQLITFAQVQQNGSSYPGRFTNATDILFPVASEDWDPFGYFAICTTTKAGQDDPADGGSDDGKILIWGQFQMQFNMQTYQLIPLEIYANDQLKIPAGSLTINLG